MFWIYRVISFITIPSFIYFPIEFMVKRGDFLTPPQITAFFLMILWAISSLYYVIRTWKLKNTSSTSKEDTLDTEQKEDLLNKFFLVKTLSITNIIAASIFGLLTVSSLYRIFMLNLLLRDVLIVQIIFSIIFIIYSVLTIIISIKALKTYRL